MFNLSYPAAIAAVLGFAPFLCLADTSDRQDVPVIVVTPSRVEQNLQEVGSTVVVLSGTELRERGIEFVEQALLNVPSLIVSSQGARGSQVQVRARGNEANHLLVLIDGIRVSNASTGEFDFSTLSMASIETIEVLLGPQSTLYGSDAIAGVINITTSKGKGDMGGNLLLKAGELGTRSYAATLNGSKNGFHYALALEDFSTDGISSAAQENGNTEPDGFAKKSLNLRTGYDSELFSTSLVFSQNQSDFDFDNTDSITGYAIDETANKQKIDSDHLAWIIRWPMLDGRIKHEIQLSSVNNDYATDSVFYASNSEYNTQTDRQTFEYRANLEVDSSNALQFGLENIDESLRTESISSYGTTIFDQKVGEQGAYLNWLAKYDAVDLSLGARAGNHDEFGSYSTYRVTGSFRSSDRLRFKAAYGTAYKAPNLQELYDTSFGGNSALQAEESDSAEVGVEYRQDDYQLSVNYFQQDTSNLIRYVGSYPSGLNQNVGSASSHGIELNVRKRWGDFDLDSSISQTKASETSNGVTSERIRVPEWSANLLANYYYPAGRIWLQALYRDKRRDLQFTYPVQDVTLDSYTLWDLGATYRLNKRITLTSKVENLTDEDYQEVFSYGTRGRTATVSANWIF